MRPLLLPFLLLLSLGSVGFGQSDRCRFRINDIHIPDAYNGPISLCRCGTTIMDVELKYNCKFNPFWFQPDKPHPRIGMGLSEDSTTLLVNYFLRDEKGEVVREEELGYPIADCKDLLRATRQAKKDLNKLPYVRKYYNLRVKSRWRKRP